LFSTSRLSEPAVAVGSDVASANARYGQPARRTIRSFCLLALGIFLQCSNARAQSTLAATIWNQYRVPPVLPFAAFEPDSPTAPLPGSAIAGLSQRTFDGVSTYDLATAKVCTLQNFDYPKFRGTQGFRNFFQASGPLNRTELQLLFGLDDEALKAIQSYEVTVRSARFLTIPYDQVLKNKAEAGDPARCSAANAPALKTVVKPIVADIDVSFRLLRPFSDETVQRLRKTFPIDQQRVEGLEYKLLIHQRLIALGTVD
jgi:hypothetical protein